MYKLVYTAKLVQVDSTGNPNGNSYTFAGSQLINSANPQNSDIATAATAMGADLTSQIQSGFAVQQATDSDNDGSGGAG